MTEHHDTTPSPGAAWRARAGAIARTITAIAIGAAAGYTTHNAGLGVTAAAAAISLIREAFTPPPR